MKIMKELTRDSVSCPTLAINPIISGSVYSGFSSRAQNKGNV